MSLWTKMAAGATSLGLLIAGGGLNAPAASAADTTASVALISTGASWKYHNRGRNLGTSWRAIGYADGGWSTGSGRLGTARRDIDRNIGRAKQTAYFRRAFTVADPTVVQSATLRLRRDDGAVVYLNGREIARQNMPKGRITFGSSSSRLDPRNGNATYSVVVPVKSLLKGKNVLAVEVHQYRKGSWMSRDVMFRADLRATVTVSTPPPPAPEPPAPPAPEPPAPPAPEPPATDVPAGWKLVDGDEFTTAGLDAAKWLAYDASNGRGRYGNADPNMLGCHSARNVVVADGVATLSSKREPITCGSTTYNYSQNFLGSGDAKKYYPLYGRFEIRARVPHGQGVWTQFWLRHIWGSDDAEVDILEAFHSSDPGTTTSTVHFPNSIGKNVAKVGAPFEAPVVGTGGWHVFAVDIDQVYPGRDDVVRFTFSIDGKTTLQYTNTNSTPWTKVADKSRVWNIAIGTSIGGTWSGHPDQKLGWFPASGGRCSLERPQRLTTDAGSCADERTPGAYYNKWMTSAPKRDGEPDIWLAPWNYGKASDYVLDYFRYYERA